MSDLDDAGLLVVGAGQAAAQLAVFLRDGGYPGKLTLVGEERHLPYQRPPLSKSFLKGAVDESALPLRGADFYREANVRLITGERVDGIALRADGSGTAVCATGRALGFSRLVLATGAGARRLPIDGAHHAGVHALRSLHDARRLRAELDRAGHVVVLGGGFIGLEVAATARALGKAVTVVEVSPALLGRAVSPEISRHIQASHEAAGIRVMLATRAERIVARDGRVSGVELANGTTLAAEVVVVGIGARPRSELAERAGLLCRDGIVVDEHGITSDGVSLAVGDCARTPDPTAADWGGEDCRLESVDSAVEQARSVAATLLGTPAPYRGVPWFWSDQGVKLQIAGISRHADLSVIRRYPGGTKLTVVHYRAGAMVAAEAVNAPADAMTIRRAVEQGVSFPPQAVADPSVPFKALLAEPAPAGDTAGVSG